MGMTKGARTRTRKNTPKGKKKSQGHRAKVERTGDKKNRKTNQRNIQQKQRHTDGRSSSFGDRKQWALLHHADRMPHGTGAAVLVRGVKQRWTRQARRNNQKQHTEGQEERPRALSRGGEDRRQEQEKQTTGTSNKNKDTQADMDGRRAFRGTLCGKDGSVRYGWA
jgi:hypothetical protein